MTVSVLIPYRSECEHRARALAWVVQQWSKVGSEIEVVVGSDTSGAWRKAVAVRDALSRACGQVLVITDADVWCDTTLDAVQKVRDGMTWVVPHRSVQRLSVEATAAVLRGTAPSVAAHRRRLDSPAYAGVVGGGLMVLSRATYEACSLDSRFAGWGGEDEAWGWALATLFGSPHRLGGTLWHLWHPPAPRLTRVVGSRENDAIRRTYYQARQRPDEMKRLLSEAS